MVNGGYSEWSTWSGCSKSCGGGVRIRSRSCTNPRPSESGKDCTSLGEPEELEKCNDQPCEKGESLGSARSFEATNLDKDEICL